MLTKLRAFVAGHTVAISLGLSVAALGVCAWSILTTLRIDAHAPPSVAAPAAPPAILPASQASPSQVAVDGKTITIPPGSTFEYSSDTTHTGGVISEQHERRSTGTGAGLHTSTEGGAVGFTGASAPNASLGADDTAGATGGSSGSLQQKFAGGLNLCQLAAIACGGFAVWFLTRKPPNKVAALYSGLAAGGLWYAGEHPWVIVAAVLIGLCVLAWKAAKFTSASGALDSLVYGIKKVGGTAADMIHKEADGVSSVAEKAHIAASKEREGA